MPRPQKSWWLFVIWRSVSLPIAACVYWIVGSAGIRNELPVFAMKLHRLPLPLFSYLSRFKGLESLDLAHVFALILMIAVLILSKRMMTLVFFRRDDIRQALKSLNTGEWLQVCMAVVLILGDACVFFSGLSNHANAMWGGQQRILVPAISTAMYIALILFLGYCDYLLEPESPTQEFNS